MARPEAPSTQSKSAVNIQYRRFRIFILYKKVIQRYSWECRICAASLPVFASGSACGRSRHRATRYAAIDNPENRMSHREMQVLDDLHVIGRDDYADVAQGFHFPALETRDADRRRSSLSRHLQGVQNIFGVAAPAYGHRHISWLHKIPQLFRKDVFIAGVVCPSCQSWKVVGKREGA